MGVALGAIVAMVGLNVAVLGGVGYLFGALIGGFGAAGGLTSRIIRIFT